MPHRVRKRLRSPRGLSGRAVRATATAGAIVLAYIGGIATGVVGTGDSTAESPSVVDTAAHRISRDAARPVGPGELREAAVKGMLRRLSDPWSQYYSPIEYRQFLTRLDGGYSGVGLWLREDTRRDDIRVLGVQPGSSAERAGIHAGDTLVRVAGRPVRTASVTEVAALLRGGPHSEVRVTVDGGTGRQRLTLTRSVVQTRDVTVRRLDEGGRLVRVAAFSRGTGHQVSQAVNSADSSRGFVLDLRGNPGGLLDEAVTAAAAFLDGGPVVSYKRRGDGLRTMHASAGGDTTTPLVVLVNGGTASAAEVVAAALQERGRAVVVGSRTFGKAAVQEPYRLPDGSAVKLTVGRYLTSNGRNLAGTGVRPDVPVAPAAAPEATMRRAVEVLNGLVAALPPAKE